MKTKLYKMWIAYCKSQGYFSMGSQVDIEHDDHGIPKIIGGNVWFNALGSSLHIKYPSPEYDAWRAFMMCSIDYILPFILINWDMFKSQFPSALIWLELNLQTPERVLKDIMKLKAHDAGSKYSGFCNCLIVDLGNRKHAS